MADVRGELLSFGLGPAIALHLNPRTDLKTVRVDIFLAERLEAGRNTRLALIARLLERGTRRLPDLRALNSFLDELYGADFAVGVEQHGEFQALRVSLETVDARFLPAAEDLQARAVGFLHEVLREPLLAGDGFRPEVLAQEKAAQAAAIAGLRNDKQAWAHRRCVEVMCAGEPYALSVLGDAADLPRVEPRELFRFYQGLLAGSRIDVYVSGRADPDAWRRRWERFFDWPRQAPSGAAQAAGCRGSNGAPHRVTEALEVSQGRLVLGYRSPATLAGEQYAALLLLNELWGGDSQSRLFRSVREQAGLCYHIGTEVEATCGLLFVSAGIEPVAYGPVLERVEGELAAIAGGGTTAAELRSAQAVLQNRLLLLDEDPAGLVAFDYQHRLGASVYSRASLARQLQEATVAQVAELAGRTHLDTAYFARPVDVAPEGLP